MVLLLSRNPITSDFLTHMEKEHVYPSFLHLEISKTELPVLNTSVLRHFSSLKTLNLSSSRLEIIQKSNIQLPEKLQVIDPRACSMTDFPRNVFRHLSERKRLYADSFRLCCPQVLRAGFSLLGCQALPELFSSCDHLLHSSFHRVAVFILGILAKIANLSNFIYLKFAKDSCFTFDGCILLTHLCVSDFLMGFYLVVIGVADRIYSGTCLWQEVTWKTSLACKAAGFLSPLSTEVLTLIICLITSERLLIFYFPLTRAHLWNHCTNTKVCAMVWTLGILLAITPVLPVASRLNFYGQSSICAPLNIFKNSASSTGVLETACLSVLCTVSLLTLAGTLNIRLHISSSKHIVSRFGSEGERNKHNTTPAQHCLDKRLLLAFCRTSAGFGLGRRPCFLWSKGCCSFSRYASQLGPQPLCL